MSSALNLRQVSYFVAAAQARSMTEAAANLHLSASAISPAIAELEASLGTQLFLRRRGFGLTLTDAGRAFLGPARELLAHAEEVRADASAAGTEIAGRLVIGCFRVGSPLLLPELIESFSQLYPAVSLDFVEGRLPQVLSWLREGRCEIAIAFGITEEPSIVCEPILEARHHILLAPDHPLADHDEIALADLAGHEMIVLDNPSGDVGTPYGEAVFAAAGVEVPVRYRAASFELVRALVARGLGFGVQLIRPDGDRSYDGLPLVARPIVDEIPTTTISLVTHEGARLSARARAFAEHCRRTVATPEIARRLGARVEREQAAAPIA